jgi:hypothetical protein
MRTFIYCIIVALSYIFVNVYLDNYITNFRENNFVGEYSVELLEDRYDFINIGRSIGADSFNWKLINNYSGLNMGMAGKPLSSDKLLLEFYDTIYDDRTTLIIPITFSFFCTNETPYTPFETIYKYRFPLYGMVQSNATLEYYFRTKSLNELTGNRNYTIPKSFFPNKLYVPEYCEKSNLDLYIDIINNIEIDNNNIILLITPHFLEFSDSWDSFEFIWFYENIEILTNHTGIRFIDHSGVDILQNREFFNDFVHLNQKGRDVYTYYFVNYIQ